MISKTSDHRSLLLKDKDQCNMVGNWNTYRSIMFTSNIELSIQRSCSKSTPTGLHRVHLRPSPCQIIVTFNLKIEWELIMSWSMNAMTLKFLFGISAFVFNFCYSSNHNHRHFNFHSDKYSAHFIIRSWIIEPVEYLLDKHRCCTTDIVLFFNRTLRCDLSPL